MYLYFFAWITPAVLALACASTGALTAPSQVAPSDVPRTERQAVDTYLTHLFYIYLGVRACADLRAELKEDAFATSVTLEEARKTMHAVEDAAREIGIDTEKRWTSIAPAAVVTSEALKQSRSRLLICQRMGGIFRIDEANLQSLLHNLGAKQDIIPKDF